MGGMAGQPAPTALLGAMPACPPAGEETVRGRPLHAALHLPPAGADRQAPPLAPSRPAAPLLFPQQRDLANPAVEALLGLYIRAPPVPLSLKVYMPTDTRTVLRIVRNAAGARHPRAPGPACWWYLYVWGGL